MSWSGQEPAGYRPAIAKARYGSSLLGVILCSDMSGHPSTDVAYILGVHGRDGFAEITVVPGTKQGRRHRVADQDGTYLYVKCTPARRRTPGPPSITRTTSSVPKTRLRPTTEVVDLRNARTSSGTGLAGFGGSRHAHGRRAHWHG